MQKPGRAPVNLKNSKKSPHLNWQVDFDYLAKLSTEELAWLDEFARDYYHPGARSGLFDGSQLRERWTAAKANARDLMSRLDGVGRRSAASGENASDFEPRARYDAGEDASIRRIDRAREQGRDSVPATVRSRSKGRKRA
jgi:hypothetical protein